MIIRFRFLFDKFITGFANLKIAASNYKILY
jgi:hypothetical protein